MSSELERISQILQASLDFRQNKQAELALRQEEKKPGFSITLLQIVAGENVPNTTRLAAALYFKNFIKRNWVDEDGNYKLNAEEAATIKRELVGLMISVPQNIQSQLGDAVGIIADSDFYERWDTLVDDLVSRLTADNPTVNNGVLTVAHSIFKRWRPLYRSDALFTEINHVISKFCTPFLSLLENTDNLIAQNMGDKKKLGELVTSLDLMMKLLYDLSCQDLPPIFEENMRSIAALLRKYLVFDAPILHTDTDSESGPLEYVKSGILEVLGLYVQKFEDDFESYVPEFLKTTWDLLTTIGIETKYDILVSKALHFLTAVTRIKKHAENFGNEGNMSQVVEKVILPNLTLRESDVEMFEDEPIEFIRRDLEGSDSDTRRRAATDFLRGLMDHFEKLATDVLTKYYQQFLAAYQKDPAENWKHKDTAVYIFTAIAARGAVTQREGVKTVNKNVDIIQFFQEHVASDLVSEADTNPLLKVDAIKYLYVFRSQLSRDQWAAAFPKLIQNLASSNYVVYSYAAIAVERALALNDENGQPVVAKETVQPQAGELVQHLFNLIEKDKTADKAVSATKIQENEFLMRCLMRVLIVIQDGLVPLTGILLDHFTQIMDYVSANPSNPRFCYYLFEAIGAVIHFAGPSQHDLIESKLFPACAAVIQNDVQDFMPYVFQLFAALLEQKQSPTLSDSEKTLIEPVLKADYWLLKGNVPALVRLLSAMLNRAAADFVAGNQIEPVLGIFERLFSSKANELQAIELLETIFLNFPKAAMENFYTPIMSLVLNKLQNSKTDTFEIRFTRLYHFISAKARDDFGADFFIGVVEKIQDGVYVPLYLKFVLPTTSKLARPLDRKAAVISFTKTLTESEAFAEKYKKGWGFTCDRLLELLINPPIATKNSDAIAENDVDDMSFGVGFTQLATIRKQPIDYWPETGPIKPWVVNFLKTADQTSGGKFGQFAQERLADQSKAALQQLLAS